MSRFYTPATIPCAARARQAEEAAIQQTFFPTRGQINGFPGEASDHPAQRLTSLNTQTQGSGLHPAEVIGSRFCRAPDAPTSLPTVSDDRHDGEMQSAETDETHGAYSFYDGLPSPRWRLAMVVAVLGFGGARGGERLFLSRRVGRRGCIADAPAPRGGR